jgi:hypothetical protein
VSSKMSLKEAGWTSQEWWGEVGKGYSKGLEGLGTAILRRDEDVGVDDY